MAFFTWNESYSLKIAKIDEQHKKLFKIISDFYYKLRDDDKQAYVALFTSLIDYTKYHFRMEEALFAKYDYPDSEEHLEEHRKFHDKVVYVKDRHDHGGIVIPTEITSYLRDWLMAHINGSDKKYAEYFSEQGIEVE